MLGTDLAWAAGDLVWTPGWDSPLDGAGNPTLSDLDALSGVPNFDAANQNRVNTVRGTDPLWPGYGMLLGIGQGNAVERQGAWAIDTMQQLQADSRVLRVEDFTTSTDGNTARFGATLVLRNGQEQPGAPA